MLHMVSGVSFFTFELQKINEIAPTQKQGLGSYTKTSRNHIVMCGGGVGQIDEALLGAFLAEIFHPAYRNVWPHMEIMTSKVDSIGELRSTLDQFLERRSATSW